MTRKSVILSAILMFLSVGASADRYVVTDDAFGNTDAKALSSMSDAEAREAIDEIESDNVADETEQRVPQSDLDSSMDINTSQTSPDDLIEEKKFINADLKNAAPSSNSFETGSPESLVESTTVDTENPFERALRESQENETDEVIRRLRAQGGDASFDATKVNPAEFVDSEDLLQGNVNSDGERPFYVTFDSDGESNVIFYSPQVIKDEIKRREQQETVSDAVVFTPDDAEKRIIVPDGADPLAIEILSSGNKKSYFERFEERCCENLPNVGVLQLRTDKGLHVPLERDDFSFRFVDGDSRYRLVRLPDLQRNYLLTIKTYVKSYRSLGIESGAFIPQIVMLDRDKNVQRIISDISMESHAETWSSYGFLKSVIEVKQDSLDPESMLVVYTRSDDLRRNSTVEDTTGTWYIKHMEVGSIEIAVANP